MEEKIITQGSAAHPDNKSGNVETQKGVKKIYFLMVFPVQPQRLVRVAPLGQRPNRVSPSNVGPRLDDFYRWVT